LHFPRNSTKYPWLDRSSFSKSREAPIPYPRNADLPSSVRNPLPGAAQTLFRRVVNSELKQGETEEAAFRAAWSAVSRSYTKPEGGGKWVHKAVMDTLYVRRNVENAADIINHFKEQGFETTLQPTDLHVTVMYSRAAVMWPEAEDDSLTVRSDKDRIVTPLGDGGAVVQKFYNKSLERRWKELCDGGCSWDHDGYHPHITITWKLGDIDLAKIEPYKGDIVLGPEIFEKLDEDWKTKVTEKKIQVIKDNFNFIKYNKKLGLVFGWAIVSKVDGEEYYDLQGDHIPEDSMLEAATDFMLKRRTMKLMHRGESRGDVVFAWPLTEETAKAMGIESNISGLMIAVKPTNKKLIEAAETGELKGFSIGGVRIVDEEID